MTGFGALFLKGQQSGYIYFNNLFHFPCTEESQFILEDEDYLLKYKTDLRNVVNRAKTNPKSLLRGYDVCLTKHIQPSVGIVSTIIRSAGGNVCFLDLCIAIIYVFHQICIMLCINFMKGGQPMKVHKA